MIVDQKALVAKQAEELVALYRLQLPFRFSSKSFGQNLINKQGSSVDFLEHRSYTPGDDFRTIDWTASAKSDQVVVKTFQDEISPIVEVVFDLSLSMGFDDQKWTMYLTMLAFLANVCKSDGFSLKVWCLGEKMECLNRVTIGEILSLKPQKGLGMGHVLKKQPQFSPNSIRFVLSDFMIAESVKETVEKCVRYSSISLGIQILPSFEIEPSVAKGLKLLDSETNATINVRLTEDVCRQYKQRFDQHVKVLNEGFRKYRGSVVTAVSELSINKLFEKMLSTTNLFIFR